MFEAGLPDPSNMGMSPLDPAEFEQKCCNSNALFYHHVSETHSGELIMVARAELPGECPHPTTNIFQSAASGAEGWAASGAEDLVPDVHCSESFPDSNREAVARSICCFC